MSLRRQAPLLFSAASDTLSSNLRLAFKILCYLFCKKGNAKKLYKGSKERFKVFFGSFFYRKKNRHF
jgi:hypothetical protein